MYALGVLTICSHPIEELTIYPITNSYLSISLFLARTDFGREISSSPTEDTSPSPSGRQYGTMIIIRHAPRLQGETFAGVAR
jgi:hypothetical protein